MKRTILVTLLALSMWVCPALAQTPSLDGEPAFSSIWTDGSSWAPGSTPIWGGADYLLWAVKKGRTPPLVVTGSPNDPFPGALDQPGTQVLFGNKGIDHDLFSGLRANAGLWLDEGNQLGVELAGFLLERRAVGFRGQGDANGQPFLAAPFVNANTGNANVYFISQNFADPNLSAFLTGGVNVANTTRLWGFEANGLLNIFASEELFFDALLGYRHLTLDESFRYQTSATNLQAGGAASFQGMVLDPGFTVTTLDRFRTRNCFTGGQVGLQAEARWGALAVRLQGKVGLGSMHQVLSIDGQTTTDAPLPVAQAIGGIYAQASNSGTRHRNVFAVVPEGAANVCLELAPAVLLRVGYTFLYASSVVRPGDQIDSQLNPNRVAIDGGFGTPGGAVRPNAASRTTTFWAQGANFGLEVTY